MNKNKNLKIKEIFLAFLITTPQIILFLLKTLGIIKWSWFYVFIPSMITSTISFCCSLFAFFCIFMVGVLEYGKTKDD